MNNIGRYTALGLLLGGVIFSSGGAFAGAASDTAFKRAQHLRHGINASMWFAQSADYSAARLESFTTPDDIALIARMGFDHVRLSVDAEELEAWQKGNNAGFMATLDRAVAQMLADHLSVVLDVHPTPAYKAGLARGDEGPARLASLWRALAGHFSKTDPEHLFFEIMNEPEQTDAGHWQTTEGAVVDAIRAGAPEATIIASGAQWSGLEDLLEQKPMKDADIIYTFHDYEPFAFTHQGAAWPGIKTAPLRNVPYPSSPENILPAFTLELNPASQYLLDRYGQERWDAARIARMIGFAGRWSQRYHVPVYCGEFGVYRAYAAPLMRARWIKDTRTALEKNGIGWAMWDYQGDFGVVTKQGGAPMADLKVLGALGLRAPREP